MDLWTEISTNAWLMTMMLISIVVPIVVGLFVIRLLGGSVKKTYRTIAKK